MKSLFVVFGFVFLLSSTLLAQGSQGKIVRMNSNTDSRHRIGSFISTNSGGKADTYLFVNNNESGNFLVPAAQNTCDTVYTQYMKAIDFETLEKLGKDHHIYYTFYQTEVYFDGWNGNFDECDFNTHGQMITKIVGAIQAADDIGNVELRKYVQAVSKNKFFNYDVQWWKPLQITNQYVLTNKGQRNDDSYPGDISYFKTSSSQDLSDQEMALFEKAYKNSDNKTEIINFLKQRVEDPSIIDQVIQAYADNKHIALVDFSQWPVFIMKNQITLSLPDMGAEENYTCTPGTCYH